MHKHRTLCILDTSPVLSKVIFSVTRTFLEDFGILMVDCHYDTGTFWKLHRWGEWLPRRWPEPPSVLGEKRVTRMSPSLSTTVSGQARAWGSRQGLAAQMSVRQYRGEGKWAHTRERLRVNRIRFPSYVTIAELNDEKPNSGWWAARVMTFSRHWLCSGPAPPSSGPLPCFLFPSTITAIHVELLICWRTAPDVHMSTCMCGNV